MESYYYLLSISIKYVFCLHMLCIKVYRETSVGEAHHDNKMEFNRKNHEIQKAMDQKPCSLKLDQNRPRVGHLASYMGRLAQPSSTSPHA